MFGILFATCYFTVWCYMPWRSQVAMNRWERVMLACDYAIDNHKGRLIAAYAVGFWFQGLAAINTIAFHGGPG